MVSLTDSSNPRHPTAITVRPMKLSKRCEYGIKASVQLAQRYGTGYMQSREIASAETLPAKFLESILLALRSASILESKVGAGGGYRLARAPGSIHITELIQALDRSEDEESSPTNGVATGAEPPCGKRAIDALNGRLDAAFAQALGSITLDELAALTSTDTISSSLPKRATAIPASV